MVTPYVPLNTIHVPVTGAVIPAVWGTQVHNNFEALIDPPACSVFDAAGQTLTTAVAAILTCGGETYDNDAMHSTVTNPSRITCQTAGRYDLKATVEFAANTVGLRQVFFLRNGVALQGARQNATTAFNAIFQAVQTAVLAVGDYVEIQAFQSSGGNLNATPREFAATFLTR